MAMGRRVIQPSLTANNLEHFESGGQLRRRPGADGQSLRLASVCLEIINRPELILRLVNHFDCAAPTLFNADVNRDLQTEVAHVFGSGWHVHYSEPWYLDGPCDGRLSLDVMTPMQDDP
jgi:hypothetical protein